MMRARQIGWRTMSTSRSLRASAAAGRRWSSSTTPEGDNFDKAVNVMQNSKPPSGVAPSNELKLKMYSLFKQATVGPCSGPSPGMFDMVGRAKYHAWKELGNMSKEEAKLKYVSEVTEIFGGTLPQPVDAGGGSSSDPKNGARSKASRSFNLMQSILYPRSVKSNMAYSGSADHGELAQTESGYECVRTETDSEGVQQIILSRPERGNSFNMVLWEEMKRCFEEVEHAPAVDGTAPTKVIVLSGCGKHFSTGMDLSVFLDLQKVASKESCDAKRREGLSRFIQYLQDCISAPENCSVPVIAAIDGNCIGGAVDLVTSCDLRFCTKNAIFCIKETDLAIVADIGTLQRLPKLIGHQRAALYAYTGQEISGEEAERVGLVAQCFDTRAEMDAHVFKVSSEIASKSPITIRGVKKTLLHARDHTVRESLEQVKMWNSAHLFSSDLLEVMRAIGAKEKPVFK